MKTLVIVDTKLIAYYLFHRKANILSLNNLLAERIQKNIGSRLGHLIFVFVMDKGKSKRVKIYDGYKKHRELLIKKQGKKYEEKVKKFEKLYARLYEFFGVYGKVIAVDGLEADDLASIISNFVKEIDNIVFATSDIDWIRFMNDMSLNIGNYYMLHINRDKLIHHTQLEEEFGFENSREKLYFDCLAGVKKENVQGLKGFGFKTFKKLFKENNYSIDRLIEFLETKTDRYKLPDTFSSVRDLYAFNLKLFKPMLFSECTQEEKKSILEQWKKKPSKKVTDIIRYTTLLEQIYIPTGLEREVSNLKN
jgi:5'-3' exonuclease